MSSMNQKRDRLRRDERGSIMIMTALSALFLLLMVGLCIDVSRIYMVRAELQKAADAAALTAARELNGGKKGIDDAVQQANNVILNNHGFGKAKVTIATVEFATSLNGAYMNAADAKQDATVKNIEFVRVTTQSTSTSMLFASSALGASRAESTRATAGISVAVSGICDFFPAAVALNDAIPATAEYDPPAKGTLMNLKFNQGTGNSAVLADKDYIILEVPAINGNGTGETAELTAGLPNFCKKLGDVIHMTPSSNKNNGPRNSGDGMNTRFNVYANGYGNALVPSTFPPDLNINESIDHTQYVNGSPSSTPNPNYSIAQDDRRMLVVPLIRPGTYPAYTSNILQWGIFFLKSKVPTNNGKCDPPCGQIPVEYVGKAQVSSATADPSCNSGLTTAVLYK
jgi:Flp pilus assembly protein TadG